jgi:hypothetical protein
VQNINTIYTHADEELACALPLKVVGGVRGGSTHIKGGPADQMVVFWWCNGVTTVPASD